MTPQASALAAARELVAAQHFAQACLYVVATPIGNLADIGLRALHVLELVDTVACEDTRHTQALLRACGIDKPGPRWLAVHEHNEAEAAQAVIARLQAGQRVAYVSDAGTPAVSDPGARLVSAVRAAGLSIAPVPGASSVTAALSVAGLPAGTGTAGNGFVFEGFLPARGSERTEALARIGKEPRAVVLLESPHRIESLAQSLAALGERMVCLARELTKQFEQVVTLPAHGLSPWLGEDPNHRRGEFVLVLHPRAESSQDDAGLRVLERLLPELPLKTAVRLASEITGASRNDLYEQALRWKARNSSGPDAGTDPD